ncbi:MAG: hypothetical protein FD118_4191 [Rhodocyclaceae bacterium]|nr:MAG: hypothetical protein FD118_4191 [Rhodocyclaceae bacterium]
MTMKACQQDDAKLETEVKRADPFEESRTKFENILLQLQGPVTKNATHSELESLLDTEGRELLRRLVQDHLALRAEREPRRLVVVGNEGTERREVVKDAERPLKTIFGSVDVARLAYRAPRKAVGNLMPLDLELNLPPEVFSFGLQRRAAMELAKSSFESTQETIKERSGVVIGKKQLEDMVSGMAVDFDLFYAIRSQQAQAGLAAIFGSAGGVVVSPKGLDRSKLLVITTDGKGVAVIEEDLREETRKAAQKRRELQAKTDPLPETKAHKLYRRRMAQVCAVYTVALFCRKPEDILREMRHLHSAEQDAQTRPKPEHKRVWASVERDAEETIDQAFVEALLRDPKRELRWVVVVDGSEEQLRIIRRCQKRYEVKFTLVLDFIHVAGYLWKASYAFHARGSEAARRWVDEKLLAILEGKASAVAAGIRRSATLQGLSKSKRKPVDVCCNYILGHSAMMRYDEYLAEGLPIGSGVIEGACRHLLQDRLDLSGATWTVRNAEAVLKLRALRCSDDFADYWKFHEEQELQRNHLARFQNSKPPPARLRRASQPPNLRLVS